MAKIVILGADGQYLLRFRGDLIRDLAERGNEVVAATPHAEVADDVRRLGATHRRFYMERATLNPFRDLRTVLSIVKLLRRERADHVFVYGIKPVVYGCLTGHLCGCRNVHAMITGLGYAFIGKSLRARTTAGLAKVLYRASLRGARTVFFQNPDDRDYFLEGRLVDGAKVVMTNGSGVNTDVFKPGPACADRRAPISFLLIARLIWHKGIAEFVEAAASLKSRYPDVRFLLVGPLDPNPASIRSETVDDWRKRGCIEYLGEARDVRPLIARSSVYVLPSYREGTPRSVLEAMAMGKPVISTNVPGCRETVRPGVNGFLVPPRDATALAQAMEVFIREPERIEPMGAASRELAVAKFDVNKVNRVIVGAMGLRCGVMSQLNGER